MRRRITAHAEVARRAHQSKAEVMHPHAIHHHPGGQGVFRIDDLARQLESSAAFVEGLVVATAETGEEARSRQRSGIIRIAAQENVRRFRIRQQAKALRRYCSTRP